MSENTMTMEELTSFLNNCKGNGKIDQEKQVKAYFVGKKKSWELVASDRKYYASESYRGTMDVNRDGSIAFNTCAVVPVTKDAFENRAKSPVYYTELVREYLFRKYMGYDLPYFELPKDTSKIAMYNQVASEMGLSEYGIPDKSHKQLPDKIVAAKAKPEKAEPADQQNPKDDAEFVNVMTAVTDFIIDVAAPILAEYAVSEFKLKVDENELMRSMEYKNLLDAGKQMASDILAGKKLNSNKLVSSVKELALKYGPDEVKSMIDMFIAGLESKINETDIESVFGKDLAASKAGFKELKEKYAKSSTEDVIKEYINMLCGDFTSDMDPAAAEKINRQLQNTNLIDELAKKISSEFGDVVEVLDSDGKVVSSSTTKPAPKEKKQDATSEKPASQKQYFEQAPDGSKLAVSEERAKNFKKGNDRFIKSYPELSTFLKMLPDDMKCKFADRGGLVTAEVYRIGVLQPMAKYTIDPAKIHPYYSIILNSGGSYSNVGDLDVLRGVYCQFPNAENLLKTGNYTEDDWNRDVQNDIYNQSFFTHISYGNIPSEDLAEVIGKLIEFTNTLESMGLDVRFKVVKYESPNKFSLECGTKVGLHKYTQHNRFYPDLVVDYRHGKKTDLTMFRARGNTAEMFAKRYNKYCRAQVIDINELTDEQFDALDEINQ
jgi:hypothetical protein